MNAYLKCKLFLLDRNKGRYIKGSKVRLNFFYFLIMQLKHKHNRFISHVNVLILANFATGNYCDLCTGHVACNKQNTFESGCPSNAAMINLDKYKNVLIDAHNKKRNLIAGGEVSKLKPACRMATIKWDPELAKLAEYNVRQCRMNHDKCRKTVQFKYAGQNLAEQGNTDTTLDYKKLLEKTVDMWYAEVENCNQNQIDSFPSNYRGPAIGHFTVMVAERNTHMGCAAAKYKKSDGFTYFLVACNYATTNMLEFPIYKTCSAPAEECKSGKNPKYSNLCAASEKYEVNKWVKNGMTYY
uniref:Venom allergen-1 n=1 Tax=Glossina brevipalpis TaxID=37001 RepID=A0A1A9W272_9MUSC